MKSTAIVQVAPEVGVFDQLSILTILARKEYNHLMRLSDFFATQGADDDSRSAAQRTEAALDGIL
jgi:hypothetical protein